MGKIMKKIMKKITMMLLFCISSLMVSAAEIPLKATDFNLGQFTAQGIPYTVTYQDGILTVEIPKDAKLANATLGAVVTTPAPKMVGMGVRLRGEVRYTDIGSDAQGPFWGGKIMATNFRNGQYNFFVSPVLRGTKTEWQPISLECILAEQDIRTRTLALFEKIERAAGIVPKRYALA